MNRRRTGRSEETGGATRREQKLNLVSIDAILAFAAYAFCQVFSLYSFFFCVCFFGCFKTGDTPKRPGSSSSFLFLVFIMTLTTSSLSSVSSYFSYFFSHKRKHGL